MPTVPMPGRHIGISPRPSPGSRDVELPDARDVPLASAVDHVVDSHNPTACRVAVQDVGTLPGHAVRLRHVVGNIDGPTKLAGLWIRLDDGPFVGVDNPQCLFGADQTMGPIVLERNGCGDTPVRYANPAESLLDKVLSQM